MAPSIHLTHMTCDDHAAGVKWAMAARRNTKHYSSHNFTIGGEFWHIKNQFTTVIATMGTKSLWAFPESYTANDSRIGFSSNDGQWEDKRA